MATTGKSTLMEQARRMTGAWERAQPGGGPRRRDQSDDEGEPPVVGNDVGEVVVVGHRDKGFNGDLLDEMLDWIRGRWGANPGPTPPGPHNPNPPPPPPVPPACGDLTENISLLAQIEKFLYDVLQAQDEQLYAKTHALRALLASPAAAALLSQLPGYTEALAMLSYIMTLSQGSARGRDWPTSYGHRVTEFVASIPGYDLSSWQRGLGSSAGLTTVTLAPGISLGILYARAQAVQAVAEIHNLVIQARRLLESQHAHLGCP